MLTEGYFVGRYVLPMKIGNHEIEMEVPYIVTSNTRELSGEDSFYGGESDKTFGKTWTVNPL